MFGKNEMLQILDGNASPLAEREREREREREIRGRRIRAKYGQT